ncbi:MAG: class I SAM-dependent methyltransferase [Candidatus Aenigmarchaeota archaeon]|nr:class I SAM-dependent methyltransferase [Candidatus Aenigmarchaeota archaeon]
MYRQKFGADRWLTKIKREMQVSRMSGKPDILVDLGCGAGRYHSLIPARHVIGLDISRKKLLKAKEEGSKGYLILGSVFNLPFKSGSCEAVLLSEVIEHVDDQKQVLEEVKRIVRPGGSLIISTPSSSFPFLWDPANWLRIRLGIRPRHKKGCTNYTPEHKELYDFNKLASHLQPEFQVEGKIFSGRIITPLLARMWMPFFYARALCNKIGFSSILFNESSVYLW